MAKRKRKPHKAKTVVANVATSEPPVDQLALERRAAMYGLTKEQAKDQRAATHIGRMTMRGELTGEQYDGLQRMIVLCTQYSQAMATPGIPRVPKEGMSTGTDDGHEAWCQSVKTTYREAVRDIQRASGKLNLWDAFSHNALMDNPKPFYQSELQLCANVLVDYFGVG